MSYSTRMIENHKKLLGHNPDFQAEIDFLATEIPSRTTEISESDRWLSTLAVLMGVGGKDEFKLVLKGALEDGMDPAKLRECVYQATDYLGLGRTAPFIKILSKQFLDRGIILCSAKTTTPQTRLQAGNDKQIELFGPQMKESWKSCPPLRSTINEFLASNCFGDFYTRTGLNNRERELVTFCYIYAQGGADPQATSHAGANMKNGYSKEYLYAICDANVAWVGYPRTLNAMSCIDKAAA